MVAVCKPVLLAEAVQRPVDILAEVTGSTEVRHRRASEREAVSKVEARKIGLGEVNMSRVALAQVA